MPGHDTSSFVSRDRGLAGVIDGRIFAPQSGFGECRPVSGRTLQRPCSCRTPREPRNGRQESQPSYGCQENRPSYGRQENRPSYGRQKNNTNAETYGEPQTPAEPRKFSTATHIGKR